MAGQQQVLLGAGSVPLAPLLLRPQVGAGVVLEMRKKLIQVVVDPRVTCVMQHHRDVDADATPPSS
jgi:hypothetical protein